MKTQKLLYAAFIGGILGAIFWIVTLEAAKLIFDNINTWQLLLGYIIGMTSFIIISSAIEAII